MFFPPEAAVFSIARWSAATYLEVALIIITIALVACLVPAWRAIRVNPMIALSELQGGALSKPPLQKFGGL